MSHCQRDRIWQNLTTLVIKIVSILKEFPGLFIIWQKFELTLANIQIDWAIFNPIIWSHWSPLSDTFNLGN